MRQRFLLLVLMILNMTSAERAFASLWEELSERPFHNAHVAFAKVSGQLVLRVFSKEVFTKKELAEKHVNVDELQNDDQVEMYRIIEWPVTMEASTKGLYGSVQYYGLGDVDFRTGYIKKVEGHLIKDLFSTWQGKIGHIGVAVLGAGYTSADNDLGIEMSEFNGSIIFSYHAVGVGIGLGVSALKYSLSVKPNASYGVLSGYIRIMGQGHRGDVVNDEKVIPLFDFYEMQLN